MGIIIDFTNIFTDLDDILSLSQNIITNTRQVLIYYSYTGTSQPQQIVGSIYIKNDTVTNSAQFIIMANIPDGDYYLYITHINKNKPNKCLEVLNYRPNVHINMSLSNFGSCLRQHVFTTSSASRGTSRKTSLTVDSNNQIYIPLNIYLQNLNSSITNSYFIGAITYYPSFLYQQLSYLISQDEVPVFISYNDGLITGFSTGKLKINSLLLSLVIDNILSNKTITSLYIIEQKCYLRNLYLPISGPVTIPANYPIDITQNINNFNSYSTPGSFFYEVLIGSSAIVNRNIIYQNPVNRSINYLFSNNQRCLSQVVKLNLVNYSANIPSTISTIKSFLGTIYIRNNLIYLKSQEDIILSNINTNSIILLITGLDLLPIYGPQSTCFIKCCND